MAANKKVRRAARALFRLCLVEGVLNEERARQVAQWIAASGRRDALPILSDLHRLARLDRKLSGEKRQEHGSPELFEAPGYGLRVTGYE